MELTVLGGAAACPNPGQGSSSYLLQMNGRSILLDCGPNTISELRKHVELDQIERIFISHVHADHTVDLIPYRYGLKYAPGVENSRPALHMPPDGTAFLESVAGAFAMGVEAADTFFEEAFEISEYDPEANLTLDEVSVRFHRTNHPVPCWAMRIESSEGTLVYLADTGPLDTLVDFARDADILICEGTYPTEKWMPDGNDRPHISAHEAGLIARDSGAKEFVLTHIWATAGFDQYLDAATSAFGRQVTLARPGVRVRIQLSAREKDR